ncbi:sensor histidine kinase [Algoriella sp.]|uniref:sensor histidine kinase n=1 Tax=Algoriella sp. TaxID=1872434 RepID=UPI002FC9C091
MITYLINTLKSEKKLNSLQTQRLDNLSSKVDELKLENYDAKLNPHLFKNILNSIQSNAYQTYYTIDKLANVLDYILYESKANFVTVKDEIDFTKNFIEINKVKVSPLFDFQIKTKIEEQSPFYQEKIIAPLISIDFIENAFKHTDFQQQNSFIKISIELNQKNFQIQVMNKISPKNSLKKETGGHGSESLEHRLRMIYGNDFTLSKTVEQDIYIANLKINLHEFYTKMHSR